MARRSIQGMSRHMVAFLQLFPDAQASSLATLERLERQAHRLAERYCSEPMEEATMYATQEAILAQVDALIGFRKLKIPVFVNMDPRGYALKIEHYWAKEHLPAGFEKDWGGYGILAPAK